MITPEFCSFSFIAVCWALSVYLAYHLGATLRDRVWMRESRKRLQALYNSPWLGP